MFTVTESNAKTLKRVPRIIVVVGDVCLILAGIYLAFYVRFLGTIPAVNYSAFVELIPWLVILSLIIFAGLGLYSRSLNGFLPTVRALTTGVVLIALVTATASYWFREFAFPRTILLIGGCFQLMLLIGWRWIVWQANCRLHGQKRLLVLGDEADAETFLSKLIEMPRHAFKIAYIFPPEEVDEVRRYLADVDGLVVLPSIPPETRLQAVANASELNKEVYLVPSVYEVMLSSAIVSQIGDLPVLRLEASGIPWAQSVSKRVMDISISLTGLVFSLPVLLISAILVKVTSPGSAFYIQERVGQNGRVFRVYKLRTMVADAERKTGPILATVNDPRVTPVGRVLRATRLDELPQLFNVLRGDMSIVGPRPERPQFVKQFNKANPGYRYRHLVKPGLTGLAQVNGRYDTSPEDKLRYDLYYIRNYSVFLDLQIILQTIPVMLSPSSAQSRQANTAYDHLLTKTASKQLKINGSLRCKRKLRGSVPFRE